MSADAADPPLGGARADSLDGGGLRGEDDAATLAELRARAVWLAELAAWRQGLVGYLAGECGGLGRALLLTPPEVARLACARRRSKRTPPTGADGAAHGDAASEGRAASARHATTDRDALTGRDSRVHGEAPHASSAFASALARGPSPVPDAHHPGVVAGRAVVTWADAAYPPQLRELPDPPPALFVDGLVQAGLGALARRHVVAVVGSRSPSPYGREMAAAVARDLAAAGVVVVSGLALGIDAAAHEAALDAAAFDGDETPPAPRVATVAVLGCGADVEHPPGNRPLFARVRHAGLVVSEFPWGIGARPWRFPARNRVMAGLAEAVVVVEGAERSGALVTARCATELGREVLAVPGEAGRRLSGGPHRLLRQGAALCESARDVLEVLGLGDLALGWADRIAGADAARDGAPDGLVGDRGVLGEADPGADEPTGTAGPGRSGTLAVRVARALDGGAHTADQLAAVLELPVHIVLATLSGLEVDGAVKACGGGAYRLRREPR